MGINITPLVMILFGLACFITGVSKAGLGGTLGFLITPMLALALPLDKVVGLVLPVLIVGDVFTLAAYWRRWEARRIWVLLAGAVVGVTLATFVLVSTPVELLKKGLALLVMVFVAYRLLEQRIMRRLSYHSRPWHGVLAGSVAGFSSTLAHAGGPPISIYLLLQRMDPTAFIATSALFFCALNWIKAPYYFVGGLFDWDLIFGLAWLIPLVPVGVWVGKRFANRMDQRIFDKAILALLVVASVLLLL